MLDDSVIFDLSPVSLWVEDYSRLKALFDAWRAEGVRDLRHHFAQDMERVSLCARHIDLVKVNRRTLDLYEAESFEELAGNLDRIFRDDMLAVHAEELVQLWNGEASFSSHTCNYTMSGRRVDVLLRGTIMPGYEDSWERVLVALEDVTESVQARRNLAVSEAYARGLFEHSPVSLWVEDFSAVKRLINRVREQGIADFRVFTDVHPEFVEQCASEIRVLEVNRHTLQLFGAPDKATLMRALDSIFRDEMLVAFREQLIDLWDGKLFQQREVVNYALDGTQLHVLLQFSVLPGHEEDWGQVQVGLTDITARKKAEAYLEYLGKHDVLTRLYNRSFYVEELNRLDRKGPRPVTLIIIDLNDLKSVNDQLGHAAGDDLLRRIGEVLNSLVEKPSHAARIGGDEFAVLLPGLDAEAGEGVLDNLFKLVTLNNQFHSASMPLHISVGMATSTVGERMENVVRRADLAMYANKRTTKADAAAQLDTSAAQA
ncbi:diguanylate cyclase [Azorhizobium oxalatiphilum]|uniref:Diguanylate cyclase n=1 Tax=Azorhizobium oxalatiphilum TaxID=980631 RepID=A0A917C978_9HYPH|nr:sensor domain-containing diguanylate cyclase [Azorhizobium oxalatiphilum]GGF78609.1 diguanylate cyclase [Azorhizobium oxalatiphilum]